MVWQQAGDAFGDTMTGRDTMTTCVQVPGMSCPQCAEVVRQAVVLLPGIRTVAVDRGSKLVVVTHDSRVHIERIMSAIEAAGYDEVSRQL